MPFFEDFGQDFRFMYGGPDSSGYLPAMHMHPHYEFLIVANHCGQTMEINGHTLPLISEPTLTVFPPFCMHKVDFSPNPLYGKMLGERYIFYAGDLFFGQFRDAAAEFAQSSSAGVATRYVISDEILHMIYPLLRGTLGKTGDPQFLRLAFLTVLHTVLRYGKKELLPSPVKKLTFINSVMRYTVEHCREGLTSEQVAAQFFVSRSKLEKDLRKFYSAGFHQLLTEMKLSQAIFLLKRTDKSVSDIARELGYEKINYFFIFFKKHTGVTPLQYRKTHK